MKKKKEKKSKKHKLKKNRRKSKKSKALMLYTLKQFPLNLTSLKRRWKIPSHLKHHKQAKFVSQKEQCWLRRVSKLKREHPKFEI